jgi:DNA-binding MarR family transcriptional regulator
VNPAIFLRLWTAAHRAERLVALELSADGVDGFQLALLLLLAERRSATTSDLARALGVPFMTASDALQRLADAGDVERHPNPADRRSHLLSLTRAGAARAKAAQKPLERAARTLAAATEQPLADLEATLAALNAALDASVNITEP